MKSFSIGVLFLILFSIAAVAANPVLGRVNIPFAFSASGQTFEPGVYLVRNLGHGQYQILNAESNAGAILLTQSSISASDELTLVFRQYEGEYFLAGMHDKGTNFSAAFTKSKAERIVEARYRNPIQVALAIFR